MVRSYMSGFETGALLDEPSASATVPLVVGSVAIESTTVRTGTYSLKLTPASGAQGYCGLGSPPDSYIRFYLRVTSLPASTARQVYGGTGAGQINLLLNTSGTLALRVDTTVLGTSSTALTDTGKWYRIEVKIAAGSQELKIDGTSEATGSEATPTNTFRFGAVDTAADTYTAYVDDISVDGAGYPGDGKVVALFPTSLNSAGGWVEGDGAGTANMAAAVSTTPPPGVASASETNATNIESPTNSATDDCDMNMTTYTAAGIGSGDTIYGVMAWARHGEDIATGTKSGALTIVSNPTQSGEDVWNYGADAGAHGADSGGNWRTARGTVQTSPSVTLGTAPVLRVGKRTATTRVVCVSQMGIYVDYTPGGGPAPTEDPFPYIGGGYYG